MGDIYGHYAFLLCFYLSKALKYMEDNYDIDSDSYKYLNYLVEIGEDLIRRYKNNE